MTNIEALKRTCNAICNTFFPDSATLELMLYNKEVASSAIAQPMSSEIVKIAIEMVMGFVETSRTENGISMDTDISAVRKNIIHWCSKCGLDASLYVVEGVTVENGSNLW